jgi:hypothetical protein
MHVFVLSIRRIARRPVTLLKQEEGQTDTTAGRHFGRPHHAPNRDYSISGNVPRLHCIHARHSSSNKQRVTCAVVALRSKTLAFLSSHSVCITNMMKEFSAFLTSKPPDGQEPPLPELRTIGRHNVRQAQPRNRPGPDSRRIGTLEGEVV